MDTHLLPTYIANLPIGSPALGLAAEDENLVGVIDPNNLPDGVVTGGNLVEFDGEVSPALRTSVALSLLAAQRVATNDQVVANPDQWLNRYLTVLENLNWTVEGGGKVEQAFDSINVGVHQAIIPFLTAALGGPVAATSLIVTALKQLKTMDEDSPWITLFDRESRRFNVSEYHFTRVAVQADRVLLHLSAARFDATYGKTQVLFFKITKQKARFEMVNSRLAADTQLLILSLDALKTKLGALTNDFIRNLDL
jgi:hypothetical protein